MALHATKKTLPRLRSLPLPAKINLQTTLKPGDLECHATL